MTVVEGRAALVPEVAAASPAVRKHVGQSVAALLMHPSFHNALPGILSNPEREEIVLVRLNQISSVKDA